MIGIGIEKEIFSSNYFSYHYGYKNLKDVKLTQNSKLIEYEKKLLKYFTHINFNVLFLNVSSKGNYINFCMNEKSENVYNDIEKYLRIKRHGDADSFSIKLNELGSSEKIHREIYIRPQLDQYETNTKIIKTLLRDYCPAFYAIGFDIREGSPQYNDIHLELYPHRSSSSSKHFINTLTKYGVSKTKNFERYFLKFKKFSHIKFRIKDDQITNIKYYRSINVNVPEFYYE